MLFGLWYIVCCVCSCDHWGFQVFSVTQLAVIFESELSRTNSRQRRGQGVVFGSQEQRDSVLFNSPSEGLHRISSLVILSASAGLLVSSPILILGIIKVFE